MGHVFLSYAREDVRRAEKVAAALEAAGHEVWWDGRLKGGSEYSREIDEALKSADAVVVLWSTAAIASEWVRDEAAVGKQNGRLVPARVDASEPPLGFRQHHTIDLSRRGGGAMAQLIDAVNEKKGAGNKHLGVTSLLARRGPRWRMAAVAAAVLLTVAAVLLLRVLPVAQRNVSLAVLPFADLSPGKDKAYFAEGVAEEILSSLSAEPGIKVLGRTSARQIEHSPDPQMLRKKLGVTHLLEGSARTAGDQLRINVRLIDTSDGSELWDEKYQGKMADIFVVQDQIAATVLKRLRGTLFGAKSQREAKSTTVGAYEMYLAARSIMRDRSVKRLQEALALAQQVIRNDPSYAPGHALLAELLFLLSDHPNAYGTIPIAEARKLGVPQAKSAINLAPKLADGYAALGLLLPAEQAIQPLMRAVRLDPSRADVRSWLAIALDNLGRHDEALGNYRIAAEIEPLWPMPVANLVPALTAAGHPAEALQVVRDYRRRGGAPEQADRFLSSIDHWQGDISSTIAHGKSGLARDPSLPDLRARMTTDYFIVGLFKLAPGGLPAAYTQHMSLFYAGNFAALRKKIMAEGPGIWRAPDGHFAFFYLAASRDWPTLAALYNGRPISVGGICEKQQSAQVFAVAIALRRTGNEKASMGALHCLRQQISVESRMTSRNQFELGGSFEFDRASLFGLDGKRDDSLRFLKQAVDQGWLGRPYSSRIADYPQFDLLENDPRLAALQKQIDSKLAKERAEVLAQR